MSYVFIIIMLIVADVLMHVVAMEKDDPGGEANKVEVQSKGD